MKKTISLLLAFFVFVAISPVANSADLDTFQNDVFSFQYPKGALIRVTDHSLSPENIGLKFKANSINFLLWDAPDLKYIYFNDLSNRAASDSWEIILSGDLKFPEDIQQIASTVNFTLQYLQKLKNEAEARRAESLKEQEKYLKQRGEDKKNAKKAYGFKLSRYNNALLYGSKKLFDACPGLHAYENSSFYGSLADRLSEAKIFPAKEEFEADGTNDGGYVKDACYSESAQKVLMLFHGKCTEGGHYAAGCGFGVAEYDIKNNGFLVTRWWGSNMLGYIAEIYPEEFGLRKKTLVQIPAAPSCDAYIVGASNKSGKICPYVLYTYNLQTKKLMQKYWKYRVPTPAEIQAAGK